MNNKYTIPADVPKSMQKKYIENYEAITRGTGKVLLLAGDQKFEHMNPIPPRDLFEIASSKHIGVFATQLGLIAGHGNEFKNINYIAKLNSKSNLISSKNDSTISRQLWSVKNVLDLEKNSGLKLRGVGYSIYSGSLHETIMFQEAAKIIYQAHQNGLLAIIWSYLRLPPEESKMRSLRDLSAGACAIADCLGADFVKIKPPKNNDDLQFAVKSAGNRKVICSGGEQIEPKQFLEKLYFQLKDGNCAGGAVGRNIYGHKIEFAKKMAAATSELIYQNCSLEKALKIID